MNSRSYDVDGDKNYVITIYNLLDRVEDMCQRLKTCPQIESKLHEIRELISNENPEFIKMLEKTFEQQLHSPVHPAVQDLEKHLKDSKHHKTPINNLISIVATKNKVKVSDLVKMFQSTHGNITPHQYLKMAKSGSIKESIDLEKMIKDMHIIEMYETMKVGLGEKSWVAINKRLKSEGLDPAIVDKAIDHAIIKVSKS